MISSNIYNLRRKYISNSMQEKDQIHSKSKVYTFKRDPAFERDFLQKNNHLNQGRSFQQFYEPKLITEVHKDKHSKSKIKKNKENLQSSPLQLNRYLKEYQYNCYKLEENQPSKLKVDKIKIQDGFSSDKKLGIKYRQREYDSMQIESFIERSNELSNKLNRSLSNERSSSNKKSLKGFSFSNIPQNLSQQLTQKIHPIPSKTLTFHSPPSSPNPSFPYSNQQLSLIKTLRLQLNQLKQQIQNKNIYISALQTKLQNHLIERIQVEKTLDENITHLERKVHELEVQNQQIREKLALTQNQLTHWNKLSQKLQFLFSSLQPVSTKTVFQFNDIHPEQYLDPILRNLSDLDTYIKFIRKIHQMKKKIQNSSNSNSSQGFQPSTKSTDEQICLKSLWKWLKMVGKEYQIMKQRVLAFENPSSIS